MTRRTISLDGQWDFFLDPTQHLTPETLEQDALPRSITVPGPWQAQSADLRTYTGVAWYRTRFQIADNEHASQAGEAGPVAVPYIHFGAVDYHATVWLNGTRIGEHEGGYLPFELCLDKAMRWDGMNELVVRVIDPDDDVDRFPNFPFAEIPHGKQSWYGPISGIWQSVSLELRHRLHITRLQITPDVQGEQALITLYLSRPAPEGLSLLLTLSDPLGHITQHCYAVDEGEQRPNVALAVPHPLLWDTSTPHLYQVEAGLYAGPEIRHLDFDSGEAMAHSAGPRPLDTRASHFGMRSISTTPDGYLLLNDRILYLRGALDQDYYPHTIYTPFSDEELDEQFAKAKHMGLNCLRTHIKITDPRYYDAADRAGILIWTELPNWETLTAAARRRARETIAGMVERDWNHPSIVIWTIINEGWGVDLAINADHRAWLAETYGYLKELDPYRLVVGNSPCYTNFHVVTDIEDFHNYYAIPDHYRKWREWVQVFAGRPSWTFAHMYERYDTWREFLRDPWNPLPRTAAPEVRRRGNEPMVVSEFGNWGLPDVSKLKEGYGGEPWWFESGLEWAEGVVYPHGIEQRFAAFHLDKVFPTLSDLVAASQRMQFTALKYQIEQMRRYHSIVGYIITEFTDVHWECNGLLDMFRNPKAFYDVIGNVNSADAIIPDWDRVTYWEGERCEVRLALSHFSTLAVAGYQLEWHLDLWPDIKGTFEAVTVQPGTVAPIGTVVFDVPMLEQSTRVRLECRLLDPAGEVVTYNHHELYVFPRRLATPGGNTGALRLYAQPPLAERLGAMGYTVTDELQAADMAVVETMSDELRWYLQNGGRILWLPNSGEAQQTYLGSLNIAQRQGRSWQGDWASTLSWIRQDRLFGAIPTNNVVDFAFADLTPEYVIVGLRPRDFAADVHAGIFVGWVHQIVALIAERRFDQGNLLTCTFRLSEQLLSNPVACIMLHNMLEHLARPMPTQV